MMNGTEAARKGAAGYTAAVAAAVEELDSGHTGAAEEGEVGSFQDKDWEGSPVGSSLGIEEAGAAEQWADTAGAAADRMEREEGLAEKEAEGSG
jgi:hypothetical protein